MICISRENIILNLTENKTSSLFHQLKLIQNRLEACFDKLTCYCKAATKLGFSKLLFHSHGFNSVFKITLAVSEVCISTFVYYIECVTKLYALFRSELQIFKR